MSNSRFREKYSITLNVKPGRNSLNLKRVIGISREICNYSICLQKRYFKFYRQGYIHKNRLLKGVTKRKRVKKSYWDLVYYESTRTLVNYVDYLYKSYFNNKKRGIDCSVPSFFYKDDFNEIIIKNSDWKLVDSQKLVIMGLDIKLYERFPDISKDDVYYIKLVIDRLSNRFKIKVFIKEEVLSKVYGQFEEGVG